MRFLVVLVVTTTVVLTVLVLSSSHVPLVTHKHPYTSAFGHRMFCLIRLNGALRRARVTLGVGYKLYTLIFSLERHHGRKTTFIILKYWYQRRRPNCSYDTAARSHSLQSRPCGVFLCVPTPHT